MNIIKKRRKLSNKQEEKVAEELGGKVMPASGALAHSKSDVRVAGSMRIECKFTESDTYILKLADLVKIRNEAVKKFEMPVFQIEFKGNNKAKYAIVARTNEDIVPMITFNKSLTLHSGDLFSMISKSSPVMGITFDRIPHSRKMDFVIYEWNDFLNKVKVNNDCI